MKILITGATGFIGSHLVCKLSHEGHRLVILTRHPDQAQKKIGNHHEYFLWDGLTKNPPEQAFAGVETIVNLMGEGIAERRWDKIQKKKIYDSRVRATQKIVETAKLHSTTTLKSFIAASAVGFYDHITPSVLTEDSPKGSGFMADVCAAWESAVNQIKDLHPVRVVLVRTGVVLGEQGALAKMLSPFRLGLGGSMGNGQQWMNWIHINDIVRIFHEAITNQQMSGVYNAVSPGNCTNRDFAKTLGRVLSRPTILTLPTTIMRLILGEVAGAVLNAQRVEAQRLTHLGFSFEFGEIEGALREICEKFIRLKF